MFQYKYVILNFLTCVNLYMIDFFFIICLSYNAIIYAFCLHIYFLNGLGVRILYLSLSNIAHVKTTKKNKFLSKKQQ